MKVERLSWKRKKPSKRKLTLSAEATANKIEKQVEKIRHISLPIHFFASGDIQITIRPRFLKDYLSLGLEEPLDPNIVFKELKLEYEEAKLPQERIEEILQDYTENWQKFHKILNEQYQEKCLSVFFKMKSQIGLYVFWSLFNVMHNLAMVEVAEDNIRNYGDPEKLAKQANIPLPAAERLSTNMYRMPKISWAEKAIYIQEKYIKQIFNIKHGGRRNAKFTDWDKPETRLAFLWDCLVFQVTLKEAFKVGKKLKTENLLSDLKNKLNLDLLPLLTDELLIKVCDHLVKRQTDKKTIANMAFERVIAISELNITTSYARRLFFEAQKEFINKGEIISNLTDKEISQLLFYIAENK